MFNLILLLSSNPSVNPSQISEKTNKPNDEPKASEGPKSSAESTNKSIGETSNKPEEGQTNSHEREDTNNPILAPTDKTGTKPSGKSNELNLISQLLNHRISKVKNQQINH